MIREEEEEEKGRKSVTNGTVGIAPACPARVRPVLSAHTLISLIAGGR